MLQCPPAFALTPQQANARGCSQRTVGKVAVTILCQDSDLPHRTAVGARQNPTQLAEADPAGGRQTGCRRKTQGMSGKGGKKRQCLHPTLCQEPCIPGVRPAVSFLVLPSNQTLPAPASPCNEDPLPNPRSATRQDSWGTDFWDEHPGPQHKYDPKPHPTQVDASWVQTGALHTSLAPQGYASPSSPAFPWMFSLLQICFFVLFFIWLQYKKKPKTPNV